MSPLEELEQLLRDREDLVCDSALYYALREAVEGRDTEDGDNWLSAHVLLDSIKDWLIPADD